MLRTTLAAALAVGVSALMVSTAFAQGKSNPGATLQASKSLDICDEGNGSWRYSGAVAVWNTGGADALGLNIDDCVQFKTSGPMFQCKYSSPNINGLETTVPGFTSETDALTFNYQVDGAPLLGGTIRNQAEVTINNHSGSGKVNGPTVRDTYTGPIPPEPCLDCNPADFNCSLTQGFWKTHCGTDNGCTQDNAWPSDHSPNDPFFLSGMSWLDVLNASPHGNAYYILAHQWIAMTLDLDTNRTDHSCEPPATSPSPACGTIDSSDCLNGLFAPITAVQDSGGIYVKATNFLQNNAPSACTNPGSCGTQASWAGILDSYNMGEYIGGPDHCSDDIIVGSPPPKPGKGPK